MQRLFVVRRTFVSNLHNYVYMWENKCDPPDFCYKSVPEWKDVGCPGGRGESKPFFKILFNAGYSMCMGG